MVANELKQLAYQLFVFQLGMMTCSKMYGMLRDPGVPLSLEQVEKANLYIMDDGDGGCGGCGGGGGGGS